MRVPDHIRGIVPYVPGKPIEEAERQLGLRRVVKLASNENPLGPSPRAVRALRDAADRAHRYPDSTGTALRQALSGTTGIPADRILLGNGSTEIVELLAKAFLSPQRGAVVADQAFIMYRIAVRAMNAPLSAVPLRAERHDLAAMAAACDAGTTLVYIGNPNNPTGTYVTRSEMAEFLRRLPPHVMAVVDEAYRDYVDLPDYPDCVEFLKEGANIAVLRTFSKIHGLAGLRIGYALAAREVIQAVEAVRSPFNTSVVAQAAARAALEDVQHVDRSKAQNAREAAFVGAELTRRGLEFVPSVTNFVLLHTSLSGTELFDRLLRLGVIVRPMEPYGYPRSVRVSIGTHAENLRFLEALDGALAFRGTAAPAGAAP